MKIAQIFSYIMLMVFVQSVSHGATLKTKTQQLAALEAVILELQDHYGMEEFKRKEFGITLPGLRKKYRRLVNEAKTLEEEHGFKIPSDEFESLAEFKAERAHRKVLSPRQFQLLLVGLAAELRDGHTNISTKNNNLATLGFYTASINDRLYVTGFSENLYEGDGATKKVQVGDEVLSLNGVPVQELADRNMLYTQSGTYEARRREAMEFTTIVPYAIMPEKVEGKSVKVEFKRGDQIFHARYNWVEAEEFMQLRSMFPDKFSNPNEEAKKDTGKFTYGRSGVVRSYFKEGVSKLPEGSIIDIGKQYNMELTEAMQANPRAYSLAGMNMEFKAAGAVFPTERIPAYIVHWQGKNIGVIRIPSYSPENGVLGLINEYRWAANVLKRMNVNTSMLVIDQLGNAGGSVMLVMKWLSLFADEGSMETVATDTKVTETLINLHSRPTPLSPNQPIPYAGLKLAKKELEKLREVYNSGKKMTGLRPDWGSYVEFDTEAAGEVVADEFGVYEHPVLILNDVHSASGGDFFPAMMQHNYRAFVMGEASKGLGGPVYRSTDSMPGSEVSMRCTSAYCERPDGTPLENKGTIPDIYRGIEHADFQDGFVSYAKDVLQTAIGILEQKDLANLQIEVATGVYVQRKSYGELQDVPETIQEIIKSFNEGLNEKPLSKVATALKTSYKKLFKALKDESLRELSEDEKGRFPPNEIPEAVDLSDEPFWEQVTVELPLELKMSDVILKDLWRKGEVLERLRDMEKLPKHKKYRSLIKTIADEGEAFPGNIRFANPCERLLLN